MAETGNIARIAEKISDEIFIEFGWTKVGPLNSNWNCVDEHVHGVQTHPSDAVFYYEEPFRDVRTYVQTDLKSYASSTIKKSMVNGAITSLAMQVSCAERSEEWQDRYTHEHVSYEVCGLLFIYNHDGGYDKNFSDILESLDLLELDLPENSKLAIMGPEEVHWIYNVSQEIVRMRGRSGEYRVPDREYCSFFYPQPVQRAFVRGGRMAAANIEAITGPWLILMHELEGSGLKLQYVIFYRNKGETTDEYMYLLDYIRQHEMLKEDVRIQIRSIDRFGVALNNFQRARQQ